MAGSTDAKIRVIALNRRASFDYDLGEKFEAGVMLAGSEVKMLRNGKADLSDSWVQVERGEAWLRGVNIPPLEHSPFSHDPKRARKLLLNRREIDEIRRSVERDGMTITATKLYFKDSLVKVEIALARGKKKGDKRESLKEKDAEREAKQAMSRGRRGY